MNAADRRPDHGFRRQQNHELLELSHQILELTKAIHADIATREAHE